MKLDEDFRSMFLLVDTTKKGYLDNDAIGQVYESLFFQPVDSELIEAVMVTICGGNHCSIGQFQDVLIKLEEWRLRQENAYWDFMSMDRVGTAVVWPSDALFLARSIKGDEFSLEAWGQWTSTRSNPTGPVCWDEFKKFLYFQPGSRFTPIRKETEFLSAYDSLANQEAEMAISDYQFYKEALENDDAYSTLVLQEKQQYQGEIRYESNRLVNRWNVAGVEAVIHDDGTEMEMMDNSLTKNDVTINELMAALDEKYDHLREKLLWEMVRLQSDNEASRRKASPAEMHERFQELHAKEREMRRTGAIEHYASELFGAGLHFSRDLNVLMGETADACQIQWEESKRRYEEYRKQGKSSHEIRDLFEKENLDKMKSSSTTSDKLLIDLWKRQEKEKDHVMHKLKVIGSLPNGAVERVALFASLFRQAERAQEGKELARDLSAAVAFSPSASGVALAERQQTFEPNKFSEDSSRQERLSADRIRLLKQQQKVARQPEVGDRLSEVSQTKDLGAVASWIEVTKLVEIKYSMEREVLVHFLLDKNEKRNTFASMNMDEIIEARNELKEKYEEWKRMAKSKKLSGETKNWNLAMLLEAAILYQETVRKTKGGKKDSELAAAVLGHLQTVQDVHFQETVEKMKNMSPDDVYRLRKNEYRVIRDQHLENLATLLFHSEEPEPVVEAPPVVDVPKFSAEEQRLVDVITFKYDVTRRKLWSELVEREKFGTSEERSAAIKRIVDDEESCRGKIDEQRRLCERLKISYSATELFGPLLSSFCSGASANDDAQKIVTLDESQLEDSSEENLLSELQRRSDNEIETVLRHRDASSISTEICKQKWMTSLLDSDVTFVAAALCLGVLARNWLGKDLSVRLRQDLRRYIRSAQERFAAEQSFNKEPFIEFGMEKPQANAALKLLLESYPNEWKLLRDLIGDVTAQELREAAASMTSDERVKRLAEINAKRRQLDITTDDGKEDLTSLLEEASAIKHVCRQDILAQIGETASDDDVGVSLLADLQEEEHKDAIKWFELISESGDTFLNGAEKQIKEHMDRCENIFNVLCKYEGLADDEHLLQALDKKFDALRDKVLAEALMRQIGEEEWKRMSERERQERLLKMKLEERRLRKEGNMDELARLLGDAFANDARFRTLMGQSREEYEMKLKARMEARKRGEKVDDDDDEDESLTEALDKKYDALLDKALTEALMRQVGEEEWKRMSERERQERLLKMKLEERRLRKEGNMDELARLLGDAFANDARFRNLMGQSREEYEMKLKARMEARKRGEKVDDDDENLTEVDGKGNPLTDINSRFEEERDALLRMLSGQDDMYMSEKDRQAALMRLRQSRLRAQEEERYGAAALVSGLIDREAKENERLKSDRERQRELARQRLEDLRKKKTKSKVISEEDAKIIRSEDRGVLEEAVLIKLHVLHNWERGWLVSLLAETADPLSMLDEMSMAQINTILARHRSDVGTGVVALRDHYRNLADAALHRQLGLAHREVTLRTRESLDVAALAELQDVQDANETSLSSKISDMSNADLIKAQESIISMIKSEKSENIPDTLLRANFVSNADDDVTDAVRSKYDAIFDAVAAKVLPLKIGEQAWSAMSKEKRQEKISNLSKQIKELISAGRYDDAIALLGEGLTEEDKKAVVALLLGDEEERKKRNVDERERRKQERIDQGMSREEAERLYQEEGLIFEENEKKRRRNVLEGLAMDMQAERDALLRALQEANDKLEAEKRRQAMLAKLRLQERQIRRENELAAITHLLAMSRGLDDALNKEKKRQLALARERLEAWKRKKASGQLEKDSDEDLKLDSDDVKVLADTVLHEMEAKHAAERKVLMEIMELTAPGTNLRTRASKASSSERKERVKDLRLLRSQWRNESPEELKETADEQMTILKEASAIQLALLSNEMSEEDAHAYMLVDLNHAHLKEESYLLEGLLDKNPTTLRKLAQVQHQARVDGWNDNVAGSLLGVADSPHSKEEEQDLMKALDDKYDALKDKLLAEALMKKFGQKKWEALSEKERQQRIMQIKQKEKKLRLQGKHDEVAKLFELLAISEKEIARLFGEGRASQKENLEERVKRLTQERRKQGLAVDDDAITKAVEEEEKAQKNKRKNILLTLDQNLEAEREALLAGLRRQGDAVTEERKRQLALARLRRERRQMETEEKYSAVALVFQASKEQEAALSAGYAESRQRQAALAKARLASRKGQKKRKEAIAALTDPKKVLKKLKAFAAEEQQGSSTERLMVEMERNHEEERDTLILLLQASDDHSTSPDLAKMSDTELHDALDQFRKKRKEWRRSRMMRAIKESGDALGEDAMERLAGFVTELNKEMIKTTGVLLEARRRQAGGEVKEDLSVEWLAELQHTQDNETQFTTDVIGDKADEYLDILSENQNRSRREGWNDNIGKVVFDLALPWQETHRPTSSSSAGSLEQEEKELENEMQQKMDDVEAELLEEKKKIERKRATGEAVDADAAISQLEQQFAAKKSVLSADMERQRSQMKDRLRERRHRKDDQEFEAHAAAGMVLLAEERLKTKHTKEQSQASQQKSLMQERLAARREKRRQEQERIEKEKSGETELPAAKESKSSPLAALMREPTMIKVPGVDEEYVKKLMRRSAVMAEQNAKAKEKNLEEVRKRVTQKRVQKESKADEIFRTHQREKTIMLERKSLMLDRQKTILAERIEKIKYERTQTMKEKGKKKANAFSELVEAGEQGLSEDDRMKRIADKLQKKFEKENKEGALLEEETSLASQELRAALDLPLAPDEEDGARPHTASRRLDKADKEEILKKRQKRHRRAKDTTSADQDNVEAEKEDE